MSTKVWIEKVIRRLSYVACKILPYNRSLRPDGYYPTILGKAGLAHSQAITYIEVFKGYPSDLDTTAPFYQRCTSTPAEFRLPPLQPRSLLS